MTLEHVWLWIANAKHMQPTDGCHENFMEQLRWYESLGYCFADYVDEYTGNDVHPSHAG